MTLQAHLFESGGMVTDLDDMNIRYRLARGDETDAVSEAAPGFLDELVKSIEQEKIHIGQL
ncbi:MAG: hypothetical protein QF735_13240, partial [Phycisphaeraceae bacterium]|nr:hypothetical protein [Phycisphaeraceae bacterium]